MKKFALTGCFLLSACWTETPSVFLWSPEYNQYMESFGYTETKEQISKNDIPVWAFYECFWCVPNAYVGPDGLYEPLMKDFLSSYAKAQEAYQRDMANKLGISLSAEPTTEQTNCLPGEQN